MAEYRFLTTWLLDAPRERVFDAIHDQKAWPSWWRGVEDVVELEPGDETGLGMHSRQTWRSFLPYDLVFEARTTMVQRPHLLEGQVDGELAGVGLWRLFEEDGSHRRHLRLERAHDQGLDEPGGAGRPPVLRLEP